MEHQNMTDSIKSTVEPLPIELWMEIFEDCQKETLPNIALTCHAFRLAILPFMYRTFMFHPFSVDNKANEPWRRSHRFMLPTSLTHDEIRRLNFYISDRIVPFVRELNFTPWFKPSSWVVSDSESACDDLEDLSNKFYEALPLFVNAQIIRCTDIDLDDFALQQLHKMPNLRNIDLVGCSAPATPPLSANATLHLQSFLFWHHGSLEKLNGIGIDQWMGLMEAETLEVLQVGPDRSSSFFFRDIASAGPFSSLHTLRISISTDIFSQIPLLLSKTPALRFLILTVSQSNFDQDRRIAEQFSSPLISPTPYLSEYQGPHELLHAILGTSTQKSQPRLLRRLRLISLSRHGDSSAIILDSVSSHAAYLEQLKELTHFHSSFRSLTYRDLSKFCCIFPNLQELALVAADSAVPVTQEGFLDALDAIPLPPGIITFALEWTLSDDNQDINSKHVAFKDHLATRFPSLQRLWLCDWNKSALLWRRNESGEEVLELAHLEAGVRTFQARVVRAELFY